MNGEFNDLTVNNTNITFTGSTNNTATSDILNVPPLYQDNVIKVKKRKAIKKVTIASGITLIAVATAMQTGSVIKNGFVFDPPTIKETSCNYQDGVFTYKFKVEKNKRKYKITYYIRLDKEKIMSQECKEPAVYESQFSDFKKSGIYNFEISFTNGLDYTNVLYNYKFNVEV